jgi:hypothetical protein
LRALLCWGRRGSAWQALLGLEEGAEGWRG